MWKRVAVWGLGTVFVFAIAAAIGFFAVAPGYFERGANRIKTVELGAVSEEAQALHAGLVVADLHADPLLWNRDLLVRGASGHMDVPRLIEGNVAVQVFSTVTKSPWNQNYESNPSDSDALTTLIIAQRWPAQTYGSLLNRALYQAKKLQDFAAASNGRLRLVATVSDLDAYLAVRNENPDMTAGILAVEGAHCLEGDIKNLDYLFAAGFRMVGLTHFFDNEVGGSAHGLEKGGLTDLGREVIAKAERYGMIIDLAHASPAVYDEVLAMATKPIVVSHGGVRATCDNVRNLSDETLLKIRDNGGVVGIGYWNAAICDITPGGWAKAVRHAVDVMGIDHVALGSDYDGATTVAFDTSKLSVLTQTLIDAGFAEDEIGKIMGGNALRVIAAVLPDSLPALSL